MRNRCMCRAVLCATVLSHALVVHAQDPSLSFSPFTRVTLGVQQTGASSAETSASYLADFNLTGPLSFGVGNQKKVPRTSLTGDFRFTSVTQSSAVGIQDFAAQFSTT